MTLLEVGCSRPLLVREETLGCATADHWRILYASDLHLTPRRAHLVARLCEAVERARPDAVLLGGDLIDRRCGLPVLQRCTAELRTLAPVFAIDGNHDRFLGADAVRAAVTGAGGHWLAGTAVTLRREGRPDLTGQLGPLYGLGQHVHLRDRWFIQIYDAPKFAGRRHAGSVTEEGEATPASPSPMPAIVS